MLEGGAHIRYIQELLGHALLLTTQIYTQVSIRRLCEVYAMTHLVRREPKPKNEPTTANERTAINGDDFELNTAGGGGTEPNPSSDVESLFALLDAERDEEDDDVEDGESPEDADVE